MQLQASPPPVDTKTLSYSYIDNDDEDDNQKIFLKLGGTDYTSSKKCRIKKSNRAIDNFEDITTCSRSDDNTSSCVVTCSTELKLTFDHFSPTVEYVYLKHADENEVANLKKANDEQALKGGVVYGLPVRTLIMCYVFN